MTNPLHHTIQERTSAKLLLCRQWIERINFEYVEMRNLDDEPHKRIQDQSVWFDRLLDDIRLTMSRLKEDGYRPDFVVDSSIQYIMCDGEEFEFVPMIAYLSARGTIQQMEVWRKAVQS